MNKKIKSALKKEISSVKEMTMDLAPRLASLLDPKVWNTPETMQAGLVGVATGFVADRIRGIFKDILNSKDEIDETVFESAKSKQIAIDLAKFAAQANPDEEVWSAVKKIFIKTLRKDTTDQDRNSLYEMINICKELTGTEIKILAAAHILMNKPGHDKHHSVSKWAHDVAEEIGLETAEEVLRYEDNLTKQKLIMSREMLRGDVLDSWIGAGNSLGHRLTELGRKLTDRLAKD